MGNRTCWECNSCASSTLSTALTRGYVVRTHASAPADETKFNLNFSISKSHFTIQSQSISTTSSTNQIHFTTTISFTNILHFLTLSLQYYNIFIYIQSLQLPAGQPAARNYNICRFSTLRWPELGVLCSSAALSCHQLHSAARSVLTVLTVPAVLSCTCNAKLHPAALTVLYFITQG